MPASVPTVENRRQQGKENRQADQQHDCPNRRIAQRPSKVMLEQNDNKYAGRHADGGCQKKVAPTNLASARNHIDDREWGKGNDSSEQHRKKSMPQDLPLNPA
jgi:hypothetical protein